MGSGKSRPVAGAPAAPAAPAARGCCGSAGGDSGMLPDGKRKTRDVIGCLLFLAFWVGMFIIGGIGIRQGKWQRLIYGTDYNGNVCGSDVAGTSYIAYPRMNEDYMANFGKVNPASYTFYGVCVPSCPGANSTVCNYDVDVKKKYPQCTTPLSSLSQATLFKYLLVDPSNVVPNPPVTEEDCARTNCWIVPQNTSSILFRCIPMYDVTGTTASECSLPQGINPNSPSCLLVTLKSDTTVVKPARTNILFDQLNTANQVWGRWFGDLARAWWVILVCAVGVSLVLGFSFVTLLKYCTGCMVWSTILLCLLLLTLLTGFFYYLAGLINYVVPPSVQEQLKAVPGVDALLDSFTSGLGTVSGLVPQSLDGSDPQSYQSTYAIIAYTSTAFLIIVLCIVIAARKSISTAVDVLKLGAEALRATPTLVIFPFTSVVALTLFLCWWVFIAACLASAGSITPGAAYSDVQAGAVAYATSVGLSANSTLALLSNPAINTTSVAFTESSITSYLLIYHFFGLLWTASFIQGVASLTVAGAVAGWYFSQLPKGSEDDPELAKLRYVRGRMPVCASLFRTLRFYLGSVAIGSLLIAFVQLVRTIFAYISRQLKKNAGSNSGINFLLCCINCCLKCLQACVEVITRTAYIYIAIKGDGFIRSGRRVFSLIINHGSVFFVVNVLAEVIVFLGKVLIAVSSAFIAYALLNGLPVFKVGGADQLSSTWLPILVTLFFAYFVASAFMSIYDMAVDTVLVCYVTDIDENLARHGGDSRHAVPVHIRADRLDFAGRAKQKALDAKAAKAASVGAGKPAVSAPPGPTMGNAVQM